MSADEFWGFAQTAQTPAELQELVRFGNARNLHDVIWDAMWGRIETPGAPGHEQTPTLLVEARSLANAIKVVLNDRSYATRVREYGQAHDREGSTRIWVRARIAEARKAWERDQKPAVARARLAAAKPAAQRLKLTSEFAEIAKLEAALPAPTK